MQLRLLLQLDCVAVCRRCFTATLRQLIDERMFITCLLADLITISQFADPCAIYYSLTHCCDLQRLGRRCRNRRRDRAQRQHRGYSLTLQTNHLYNVIFSYTAESLSCCGRNEAKTEVDQ